MRAAALLPLLLAALTAVARAEGGEKMEGKPRPTAVQLWN